MAPRDDLTTRIRDLADEQQWDAIAPLLTGQHPGDLADLIEAMPRDLHERMFALIDEDVKPDVLAELEGRAATDVLESLTNAELAEIVEDMAPDDAADVIADLTDERSDKVLQLMEDEESEDVRKLLEYDEESAGGIMTPDVIALAETLTVAEAIEQIAYMEEDEPFYFAYVIAEDRTIRGWIGLWEIVKIRERSKKLSEIAHSDIIAVTTDTDQEEVARIMTKYDLSAVPVTNENGKLVGRITADDVMDVMEEEASEDIFRLAGSDDAELEYTSALQACRVRLPWLLITLVTGFLTSCILKRFMTDLRQVIALSFFVPIVMAMGGNTGIQSSTLIIRGLALGTLEGKSLFKILSREITAGAIMGVFCGVIIGLWAEFLLTFTSDGVTAYSSAYLAFTVGLALFVAMTFAAMFGAFVPILLNRFRIDPAVASGPFVSASNDIFALLIYYGVAVSLVGLYYQVTGGGV